MPEGLSVVVDPAELLVSELVTNAVKHADLHSGVGTVGFRVAVDGHLLRVEVSDGDPVMPQIGDGSSTPCRGAGC